MATIDLAVKLGANLPPSVASTRFDIHFQDIVIDFAAAAVAKGTALAAADVIEALDIPSGAEVIAAGLEVISPITGATVLTVGLGITGLAASGFVSAYDLFAATAGAYAPKNTAAYPLTVGAAADTVDLIISSQTGTITGGVIRVYAVYADVRGTRRPGLAARKS